MFQVKNSNFKKNMAILNSMRYGSLYIKNTKFHGLHNMSDWLEVDYI